MKRISIFIVKVLLFSLLFSCSQTSKNNAVKVEKPSQVLEENIEDFKTNSVLSKNRYSDPNNFFKIVPPTDWRIEQYLQDPRGKVAFFGPEKVELRILAKGLDFDSFDQMYNQLKEMERKINTNTNMTKFMFFEIPAVKRQFTYNGLKILFVDFMLGSASHNIMYSAAPEKFDKYESLAWESINTYEPILIDIPTADVIKHSVAKSLRLSKIFIENGEYELAKIYIEEGLNEEPENAKLLEMQKELSAKNN